MKKQTYLNFERKSDGNFRIYNKAGERLGDLRRIRVGRFMHWCLTYIYSKNIFFSPGCQDEIRNKCRELKAKELKK